MSDLTKFGGLTVQFHVPSIKEGIEFYSRVLGRPPNFAPLPDFQEWDHIVPNVTFQVAEGPPRPTYPIRFRVSNIEAEHERIVREARPPHATPVKRFEGLVAVCDFLDPWGNAFGLYQVLCEGAEPPKLSGSCRDQMTEIERLIAERVGSVQ